MKNYFFVSCALLLFSQAILAENKMLQIDEDDHTSEVDKKVVKKNIMTAENIQEEVTLKQELLDSIEETIVQLKKAVSTLKPTDDNAARLKEKIISLQFEKSNFLLIKDRKSPITIKYINDTIDYAKAFISEVKKSENLDKSIFTAAYLSKQIGQDSIAAKYFEMLVSKFPQSKLAAKSFFYLGEFAFNRSDFAIAQKYYMAGSRLHDEKLTPWLYYKLGWCLYNQAHFKESRDYFIQSIKLIDKKPEFSILKQSLTSDISFVFFETDSGLQSSKFFETYSDSDKFLLNLKNLAEVYLDGGKWQDAREVIHKILALDTTSNISFALEKRLVGFQYKLKSFRDLWDELGVISKKFKESKAGELGDLFMLYPKLIQRAGFQSHSDYLKHEALKGYIFYESTFPNRINPELNAYIGDLYFDFHQYELSGDYYIKVASLPPSQTIVLFKKQNKSENIHKQISFNMIDSYSKSIQQPFLALKNEKLISDKGIDAKSLPEKYKPFGKFVKACELFLKNYPDAHEEAKNCYIYVIEILSKTGKPGEALTWIMNFVKKNPNDEIAKKSVSILLALTANNKDEQIRYVGILLEMPEFQKGKIADDLYTITIGYKLEKIDKLKNLTEQSNQYEALYESSKGHSVAETILVKAALSSLKDNDLKRSAALYKKAAESFSSSETSIDYVLQGAKIYEIMADYENASAQYYLVFKKNNKHKEAPGSLFKSCALRVSLLSEDVFEPCVALASTFPNEAQPLIDDLIENSYFTKNVGILSRTIESFKLTPALMVKCLYYLSEIDVSKRQNSYQHIQRISKTSKLTPDLLRFVAKTYYDGIDQALQDAQKMELKGGDVAALQNSIQASMSKIQNAESLVAPILSLKDAYWAVYCFRDLSLIYENFGALLTHPPHVTGATPDQVKAQLSESAKQVNEQAIQYNANAIKVLKDVKLFHPLGEELFVTSLRLEKHKTFLLEFVPQMGMVSGYLPKFIEKSNTNMKEE